MKTEQFQYVLELYKTGSISKAAKKFYMSRPNLSNSIRSLEDELGFEILERGVNGVKFTEKGMTFVRHCMSIVKELEEVRALADEKSRLQFGVVNPNYPPVENAFLRLCREVEGQTELSGYQMSLFREYQYESMTLLNQRKADLAITVSKDLRAPSLRRELQERRLEYRRICDLPCNVNVSRRHPLAHDPEFSFQKLKQYPFVDYAIRSDRASPFNRISDVQFVNLSRIIRIDAGNVRTHMIAESNAYGVGVAMPPSWMEANGIFCIPIPNFTMELGIIRRIDEPESILEHQFMAFLREELCFLNTDSLK
ncbi:LysR family transcriptional regulator [Lawsonibacter asaccharolyticus]